MRNDGYLTAREVAELLKLNIETVYVLAAKEQLPAVKIGGQWRFDAAELREYLRKRSSLSKAENR